MKLPQRGAPLPLRRSGTASRVLPAAALAVLVSACAGPAPVQTSPPTSVGASTSSAGPTSASASTPQPPLAGRIAYGRFDGDTVSMFTARADGSEVRPLLAGSGGEPRGWSPDGTMLAVTATNHGDIVGSTVRADGTHQHVFRLPTGAPAALPCGFWSPDGKRLVCEGFDDAHPERAGIYTVSAIDGQQLVRVTKHRDVPCSYSPDGTRILFVGLGKGQEEHGTLMSAMVDGSNPKMIVQDEVGLSCDWSPDGKTILSERNGSLLLINSTGRTTLVPIASGGASSRGAFSPDGSHIIFSLKLGGQADIYTSRTDGSDLMQITDTTANEEFGCWGR